MSSCSAICESTLELEPTTPKHPEMSAQFNVIMPYEDIAEQAFGPVAVAAPIAPFAPIKSALAPLQSLEELKPVAKKLIFEEEPTWGWNGIPLDTKYRGAFQSPRPHFPGPCALVRSTNENTPDASLEEPKESEKLEESEDPEPNFDDIPPPPPVLRRTDTIGSYATVNPGTPAILRANSLIDSSSCYSSLVPPQGSYEWSESQQNGSYPWSRVDSSSCTY
jgi:hypothetical protein